MKKATGKERKEAELWDEIRALYDKILYWFYEQEDAAEARVHARRLEPLLKKVSPHHETILGEECWSLVHELKGNYREAIRYRENEIRLIERLHQLAAGKPNGHAILQRYDYADLCDRLELLAILYHHAGNLDKAVSVLQECERLCEKHKIAFDCQDLLEEYLSEIAERKMKADIKQAKRPKRQAKRQRVRSAH
jgi:hypothetical protein